MELTNTYNLPSPLVAALKADWYHQPGHISVTGLIQPPRMRQLIARNQDIISEDVSDRIWMLLGSAIHGVLDRADVADGFQEERLSIESNGWEVTGKADLWESPGILSDYKVTSVWAYINGVKEEWETQLNCYAALYRDAGFSVEKLQIVCIFRDWQKNRAKSGDNYPPCAAAVMPVKLWDPVDALKYIDTRVALHQEAESLPESDLPHCTASERWEKPTTYAVMKKGRKRAVRVLESEEVANRMVDEGKGDYVETRPGESTRCEGYCSCTPFCSYYQEEIKRCNQ
jgi:hypothetical protein